MNRDLLGEWSLTDHEGHGLTYAQAVRVARRADEIFAAQGRPEDHTRALEEALEEVLEEVAQ
jgi:hypothetical protein